MEAFTSAILDSVFSVVGILIAAAVSFFIPKLKKWLHTLSEKDNLHIIESLTEKAVEYVEEEFQGAAGEEKFNYAAEQTSLLLHRYGIEASDDLIKTSVQQGYNRMIEKEDK